PPHDVASGAPRLAPVFRLDQSARSRVNLGLETINLYYLHNVETQLGAVDRDTFAERLSRAIGTLEQVCAEGSIAAWGLATWEALRVPREHPEHLSLLEVQSLAAKIAGPDHHFSAVQLPCNLAMASAIASR